MRFSTATTPVLAACLLLAGCSTTPTFQQSDIASVVPSGWASAPAVSPQADAAFPSRDWWTAFDDPELARLIALAEANNPDLAAAGHRIAQATANARAARAGLFPSLGGSASGSRGWRGEGPASANVSLGLDASYEVDLWGGNRAGVDAAVASRISSEFARDTVALGLMAEVATTYFQYLSLGDRLATALEVLAIGEQVLELVEAQAAAGAIAQLDQVQQRLVVTNLRSAIPTLEQQRDQSLNALAALLGTTPGVLEVAAGSLDAVQLPDVAPGLPSELLARRPDLRSAEAAIAVASANLDSARAAMFPSIRLTGSTGLASNALSSLFQPAGFAAGLAAGLTAPIFDAGRLESQRDAAAAREAEVIENYRAAVVAAFRDVENALTAIRYTAELEALQTAATADARSSYALASAQYEAGAADFITLLDAQRSLAQQLDSARQTRFGRLAATVDLFRSLGGGW